MKLIYNIAESTVKPPEVERGKTTAYFRRNFVEEERNGTTFWIYEEAMVPVAEFDAYAAGLAAENAVKGANDSAKIQVIQETGVNSTDNQLILMEAIADLYDLIATMM